MLRHLLPLLFFVPLPAIAMPATVVSVGDGYTFIAKRNSAWSVIRLGCIDVPEMSQQPYGMMAANRLKTLLPVGSKIDLRRITVDRHDRIVAEVTTGKTLVNLQLVKEGLAVAHSQYFWGCPDSRNLYLEAEQKAKSNRLGIWRQNPVCLPENFRKKLCT
jgi:micrococcal nuclease